METLLINAYPYLVQKSKLFETNSIAIGTKELSMSKNIFQFFYKMAFPKVYKQNEWRLQNDMEIKLWKLSACIKQKFYCFEDFIKPLAFFVYVKILTEESKGTKISCIKFLHSL